jgi:hypothetical protein
LLASIPARAVDQTNEKVAGIIGMIRGQTARLNLVNLGDPDIIPPGPCVSTLTFLDGAGNLLGASNLSLDVGQAGLLDLNADRLGIRGRLEIRGVAHSAPNLDPTLPDPCASTRVTLELFDNKSLQTTAFAPEPHLADQPEPERHFGMLGITLGQDLRLNVINLCDGSVNNLCDGSVTPPPCEATVGFLDANGRDLITPVVLTLAAGGGSGFVDLVANHGIIINDKTRLESRGQVSFPPVRDPIAPDPCAVVQTSVEVFNSKTGQTTVFYEGPDT